MMELLVQIKNIYGNERIYPINKTALNFTRLTNSKTLSRSDINTIKELGYKITVKTEEL